MRWLSSIGGIIATGAAIAVLVSLGTVSQPPQAADSPIADASSVEPTAPQVVMEQPVEPEVTVEDLGDDLTEILAESGYAQSVGPSELSDSLPDDVVQVLISEDAVLVIPSEEGG